MTEKEILYKQMNDQFKVLISDETDWLANLSNASSLLYHTLPQLNWSGFYLYKENMLVLGPFQGKPACVRIPLNKGVCGTAAFEKMTIVVNDVHEFPGHIACDSVSQSEIVVPVLIGGELFGVLDLDSPVLARFDETDRKGLEAFVQIFVNQYTASKLNLE